MEKMEKYNGWTNYATWRVNLECVDGTEWVREDITSDEKQVLEVYDIAQFLKNAVEEMIGGYGEKEEGLAYDYAMAFLSDVNWNEIAESFIENHPEIIERTDEQIEEDNREDVINKK